jgi:hypothetical protein
MSQLATVLTLGASTVLSNPIGRVRSFWHVLPEERLPAVIQTPCREQQHHNFSRNAGTLAGIRQRHSNTAFEGELCLR